MKPDFLCIGAEKAATSWLYFHMSRHPQIWTPPIKELNYFNNSSSRLYQRLFSKHWLNKNWRILFKLKVIEPIKTRKQQGINYYYWCFKYFFLPRNFRWYKSLFPKNHEQLAGEFSVGYATLDDQSFSKISELLPDLKIIYLLRNPIFRTWSQAKMNLGKNAGYNLEELPDESFYKYFDNPYVDKKNDYLSSLEILEKYYDKNQLFIGFFEEIQEDPKGFLKKIFGFLNLDFPTEIYSKEIYKKAHVGIQKEIPSRFLYYLSKKYLQRITQFHQRFHNAYTQNWLNTTLQSLKENPSSNKESN